LAISRFGIHREWSEELIMVGPPQKIQGGD
jgi:hypothetical protein